MVSLPDIDPVPILGEATIVWFLERREEGFGRIDDTLSGRDNLKSPKRVVLELSSTFPATFPNGKDVKIAGKLVDQLRQQLRREALESFCKTAERLELRVVAEELFRF